jgi:hypothetical protein
MDLHNTCIQQWAFSENRDDVFRSKGNMLHSPITHSPFGSFSRWMAEDPDLRTIFFGTN